MKKYTIGALFTPDFRRVLLIQKQRPDWQKGKLNLPGGHIEDDEDGPYCVAREFEEEVGIWILPEEWRSIGKIVNDGNYVVEILTTIYHEKIHKQIKFDLTDEPIMWCDVNALPENCISNLHWLIPFALNTWKQGNADYITFGTFNYQYPQP